jgi:hypothetical protein
MERPRCFRLRRGRCAKRVGMGGAVLIDHPQDLHRQIGTLGRPGCPPLHHCRRMATESFVRGLASQTQSAASNKSRKSANRPSSAGMLKRSFPVPSVIAFRWPSQRRGSSGFSVAQTAFIARDAIVSILPAQSCKAPSPREMRPLFRLVANPP